jgi:hypothetical protein
LPYSSMVEPRAVNAGVVGSSPTGAAIYCWVDELVNRSVASQL